MFLFRSKTCMQSTDLHASLHFLYQISEKTFDRFSLLKSGSISSTYFVFVMIPVEKIFTFVSNKDHAFSVITNKIKIFVLIHTLIYYLKNRYWFNDKYDMFSVGLSFIVNLALFSFFFLAGSNES